MSTEERTFNTMMSINEVFREDDMAQCLSEDLNTIESDISALKTSKAAVNHNHTGYAAENHTHTDYAASNHNHNSAYIAKALQMVDDGGDIVLRAVYEF